MRKCDESPTSCLARLENKHVGKICLKGLLIKIALSCHVQETEGIQWIVTRKNMIYHGCEHVTERHGNRLFRNDVNYSRESTNTQKNPSRIIIIINNIHNIVIFEELKNKSWKKVKKRWYMFPRLWVRMRTWQETGPATYVTSYHFNTRPRQYIFSVLHSFKKR